MQLWPSSPLQPPTAVAAWQAYDVWRMEQLEECQALAGCGSATVNATHDQQCDGGLTVEIGAPQ
eukprot:7382208-Prymnesium_polylepis.2